MPLPLQTAVSALAGCKWTPYPRADKVIASLLTLNEKSLAAMLERAKDELLNGTIGVDRFSNDVLRKVDMTHTDLPVLELFDKWAETFKYLSLHTGLAGLIRAIKSTAMPPATPTTPSQFFTRSSSNLAHIDEQVNTLLALRSRGLSTMLEAAKKLLLAEELGQTRFVASVLRAVDLSRDDVPVLSGFHEWASRQQRPTLMTVANQLAQMIRGLGRKAPPY